MLRLLGADAVGMSTVLETIEAREHGCDVLGVSLITNVHDGAPVSADDVVIEADRAAAALAECLTRVVQASPKQAFRPGVRDADRCARASVPGIGEGHLRVGKDIRAALCYCAC